MTEQTFPVVSDDAVADASARHEHVLARPVEALSQYANAAARKRAADKLVELFGMEEEAARSLSDAVVDPSDLRKALEAPMRLAVPGGSVLAARTRVWARKTLPDIRNPRIGGARKHPFAVAPGTDEESRFAPAPDPTSDGIDPMLTVELESAEHMEWSSSLAARTVLAANDWRYSIRNQGVLTEVWVAATRYTHKDSTPDLYAPTTVEGSSRVTAVHDILGLGNSVAAVATVTDRKLRARINELNDTLDRGPTTRDLEQARCESIPALVLIGFEPLDGDTASFASALRSLVALRHVDAPKPWGEGAELEHLADEILAEMRDRGIITERKRQWLAGTITRDEALASHLSGDPAVRAAEIVSLFTSTDAPTRDAIRSAVTRQSTRKRITSTFRSRLATALIVRAIGRDGTPVDRVRRYLQHGFGEAVRDTDWTATSRSADDLLEEALAEFDRDPDGVLGPARLELAARAAYPLISTLSLWADRGSSNNKQPDRRTPGQVIDAMTRDRHGLLQLHRALVDGAAGRRTIKVVDQEGNILRTDDATQDRHINDIHLRTTWGQDGSVVRPDTTATPDDQLRSALADLGEEIERLNRVRQTVLEITGLDGTSHVETVGVNPRHVDEWQVILSDLDEDLAVWKRTWTNRNRSSGPPWVAEDEWNRSSDEELDEAVEDWDELDDEDGV